MYEHADHSWRDRPVVMSPATVARTASRIAEHAERHSLPAVGVVLHGGEPLLMGPARLREALTILVETVDPVAALDLRMQTNGVRLTEQTCELLLEFGVKVGVSLDGDRVANDRHRRYRNGASSHEQSLRGLALLRRPRYRSIYAGILCTVDIANDPIAVYEALLAEDAPRIDLLLPHGTWDTPPPRSAPGSTPYADWLARVHRRWRADGRPMPIRMFDALHSTANGGVSGTEAVGIDRGELVVVEADGAWEQPDSMKTTFHGAAATGLTVFTASADEVLAQPAMRRRQAGLAGLSATCRRCPVVVQCGGGLVAHRFRARNGFDNPSVYCDDLKGLIAVVNNDLPTSADSHDDLAVLPDRVFDELAGGGGDADCLTFLGAAQESVNRALLVEVAGALDSSPDGRLAADAWSTLADLDGRVPDAVRRVSTHPFVRVWAVRCLRDGHGFARLADLIAAVACVGAVGAGVRITVAPRAGRIHLPWLGTVVLPGDVDRAVVSGDGTVRWSGGSCRIASDDPRFEPARVADLDGLQVHLEDSDPHRDCHEWPVAGQLSPTAVRSWQRMLAASWQEIHLDAPDQVEGLRRGLTTIAPLRAATDSTMRSATSRHAFGALGIAAPADPAALAVMLVHEFQHTKLGAVLDLVDLLRPEATARLTVGWRPDPRPVDGVLQGIYAHMAVTRMWGRRAARSVAGADLHYERYRGWTADAIAGIRAAEVLTPLGLRFIGRTADAIERGPR